MDDEYTAGYTEPCAQCSEVDWGISDECHFFCRSCHNIIERTREVLDPTFNRGSTRISTLGRGSKSKRREHGGWEWNICEGFQFILMKQADALIRLGVREEFKDKVLCELWRLYLQKRNLAFTHTAVRRSKRLDGSDSESAPESFIMSVSEWDVETNASGTDQSYKGSNAGSLAQSGSVDVTAHLTTNLGRHSSAMSMKTTLALIHIGLTWIREPLTLSDLLRLVNEGHVPYLNTHETFPEEMKVQSKDDLIFKVERIPSHRVVHRKAQKIIELLELPAFPPISRECLLHPALLSLRYLTDANLPDDLHPWLCRLMEGADMADEKLHTFSPKSCPILPKYDVRAAALIVVTMKLFFGLNDQTEWDLTREASKQDNSETAFSLRHWYKLLQASLVRAQNRREQAIARKQWRSNKNLRITKREQYRFLKRRKVAEQLQICFEKLSSRPVVAEPVAPSSFKFCWGEEDGADGPSMHHKELTGVVTMKDHKPVLFDPTYVHQPIRSYSCQKTCCKWTHYPEVEPTLPRMYVWLLQLFSFLLDVKPAYLYEEVLSVERRVFNRTVSRKKKKKTETWSSIKTRTRTKAGPRAPQAE